MVPPPGGPRVGLRAAHAARTVHFLGRVVPGERAARSRAGRPLAPGAAVSARRNAKLVGAGYAFVHPTFREGYGALIADAARVPAG